MGVGLAMWGLEEAWGRGGRLYPLSKVLARPQLRNDAALFSARGVGLGDDGGTFGDDVERIALLALLEDELARLHSHLGQNLGEALHLRASGRERGGHEWGHGGGWLREVLR